MQTPMSSTPADPIPLDDLETLAALATGAAAIILRANGPLTIASEYLCYTLNPGDTVDKAALLHTLEDVSDHLDTLKENLDEIEGLCYRLKAKGQGRRP